MIDYHVMTENLLKVFCKADPYDIYILLVF